MSLINRMLRDLDQRRAAPGERAGLALQVRALPAARRFPWALLLSIVGGMALGAAALWLAAVNQDKAPPSPAPTAALPDPPPAASVAAPDPVVVAMPPLVVELPPEPDAEVAPAEGLRLDRDLAVPQPSRPVVEPVASGRIPGASRDPAPVTIDKRARVDDGAEQEFRRAMALVRQGTPAEAVAGFTEALRLNERHVAVRQALLSMLVEQRRWPEAQALLAEGLRLDPAQTGWAMALARLQVEQEQTADAAATLARHGGQAGTNPDYQAFHALVLQKLQRPREAAERFRAALDLRPGEGRWWYGLAAALDQDRKPAEARLAYLRAIETGNLPPELLALVERRLR